MKLTILFKDGRERTFLDVRSTRCAPAFLAAHLCDGAERFWPMEQIDCWDQEYETVADERPMEVQ